MWVRMLWGTGGVASSWDQHSRPWLSQKDCWAPCWLPSLAAVTNPPPSLQLCFLGEILNIYHVLGEKRKWNRRKLCYCIWNLPEKFPLSSSWKIVLIWNMKLLSNLLSQRWEWKMMLRGLQVAPTLEVVGVHGHQGCLWKLPLVHQNCKCIFSCSRCFPHPDFPLAHRQEGAGGEPSGRQQGPRHRTWGSFGPPHTLGCRSLGSVAFCSRSDSPIPSTEDKLHFFWVSASFESGNSSYWLSTPQWDSTGTNLSMARLANALHLVHKTTPDQNQATATFKDTTTRLS